MSDGFPVFGFHRRSYIFLAGAVGVVGFVGMGVIGGDLADPSLVTFFLFLTTLSIAFCDVCTDALVAANAKLESEAGAGNLQSLCWASLGFGGMVISLLAGPLYEALDAQICFFLSALIPAGRMFLAWRLKEPPAKKFDPEIIRGQTRKIIKTLCHPGVHRPIIYAFLSWATIPKLSQAQFNFFTVSRKTPLLPCFLPTAQRRLCRTRTTRTGPRRFQTARRHGRRTSRSQDKWRRSIARGSCATIGAAAASGSIVSLTARRTRQSRSWSRTSCTRTASPPATSSTRCPAAR